MHTIEYNIRNSAGKEVSPLIDGYWLYGRDAAPMFTMFEFNVIEGRNITYKALVSEKQKSIFLQNVDALIALYQILSEQYKLSYGDIKYEGLTRFFSLDNGWGWEGNICNYLFGSIYYIFHAIDAELPISYLKDSSLPELTIFIEGYLKHLGKETEVTTVMQRLKKIDTEESFQHAEDIILPLKISDNIVVPEELILPSTIKYEVRQEIDGLFYVTVSEESALELSKYRKELVKLAYDNNSVLLEAYEGDFLCDSIYATFRPVFFDKLRPKLEEISIDYILTKILLVASSISRTSDKTRIFTTRRHLEEINLIAQDCLEVGMFKIFPRSHTGTELKDPVQLAKSIDNNVKSLDPPIGYRKKSDM